MDIIYDDDTDVVMDQLSNQFSRPCLNISFTFCLILLILMIVMVLFFYYTIPENFEYYTEIKFEILNPTGFMSDCLTLKAFLQLVSLKAMKNITPQFDVQIIGIRDQIGFNTVDNTPILAPIGHLLTIMYLPLTSTMYIYDSCVWQYSDTDKHKIENWLTACNLYQHVRFQWCRPLSQQLDNNSCGVYAIGYYSLLMRGFDPECVELESILHLRQNIWKMIRPFLKPVFYDVTRRNFAWKEPLRQMDRKFKYFKPKICYDRPASCLTDKIECDRNRDRTLNGSLVNSLIVPKKSARTWTMQKGDLCKITLIEGSQVGDLNIWNLDNTKEHFYSGKTRQLHSSHLKVYDKLWSSIPYLRPMATFVYDSLSDYGIDKDGGSLHDVIGTRCDDYTYKLITGKERFGSCHSYLREAIKEHNLEESDVHDVWNIFMCTGFTRDTNQYFCKPSPAEKGDSISFIAEMNLLVALSTCPQGDVSLPVGQFVPETLCHPFLVEIYRRT